MSVDGLGIGEVIKGARDGDKILLLIVHCLPAKEKPCLQLKP